MDVNCGTCFARGCVFVFFYACLRSMRVGVSGRRKFAVAYSGSIIGCNCRERGLPVFLLIRSVSWLGWSMQCFFMYVGLNLETPWEMT